MDLRVPATLRWEDTRPGRYPSGLMFWVDVEIPATLEYISQLWSKVHVRPYVVSALGGTYNLEAEFRLYFSRYYIRMYQQPYMYAGSYFS